MAEQLSLIPEKLFSPKPRKVVLTDLPDELSGPEPSQKLIESIQNYGLLHPIGLIENDGNYQVAYGRRRIKVFRKLDRISIPALIFPLGWTPQSVLTLIENTHRSDNLASKLESIADLRLRATPEEISAAVGISLGELNEAIKLLDDLAPELQAAMKEGRIRTTTAKKAAKLPPELQQVLAKQEKIKAKDVDQYINAQLKNDTGIDPSLFNNEDFSAETSTQSDKLGLVVDGKISKNSWKLQATPLVQNLLTVIPEEEEIHQYLELLADFLKIKR